jgi:predicted ATPase/class 3 adenylate cyclase
VGELPSGTVTFLFTDVEGSTRLWDEFPEAMRPALARHDELLRGAIAKHHGHVVKTTGDGVHAVFAAARDALDAAVVMQLALAAEAFAETGRLRVRMGVHTCEAQRRDADYYGSEVNRAARLMSVAHGDQIVVSLATSALVRDASVELVDLGEHRLRDLATLERVFQVCAPGLVREFPALRTVDATPGNLPVQSTSFVGRDVEVKELIGLVRAHRLVTLTGVGGVGKTRLAVQVAAELVSDFPDGVWLVELAPIGDPAAVADAAATVLGITPRADRPVIESIAEALSGRRLLVVLDNCEHVLDAAAELVEAVLAGTTSVQVIATSREGLRVGAEHLWSVPSLDVRAGVGSPAVELFVERAQAVVAGFRLDNQDDHTAVTEICRRLDGIALAIELAAARMVSMSPQEVRDRLSDRFRLLSGSRRGLERHQTLQQTVAWSYDLLDDDTRSVLNRCSVFADGFDLAAAAAVAGGDGLDEYALLDVLDSLVRKSLVTVERAGGHTRYGLLETIRQFAEDQLAAAGTITEVRDRHARYFAAEAVAHFEIWDGPEMRVALDWVDGEFANLRAGFRWAADQGDLVTAAAIAAHAATMALPLLRHLEPAGWAEELLDAATAVELPQLPRLCYAAAHCSFAGRTDAAIGYAQAAVALQTDPRYDPFDAGWTGIGEATAHLFAGRIDRWLEICADLRNQPGFAHVVGMAGLTAQLAAVGRAAEAMAIAEESLTLARDHGNPFWVAFALDAYGRAFTEADPTRALSAFREGLVYAEEHRMPYWEARLPRDSAALEAVHGELAHAVSLFDTAIDSSHRAGNVAVLAQTLASLAIFFDRLDRPEIAATVYGASTNDASIQVVIDLPTAVDHLRSVLGQTVFDQCVATGAAMTLGDAVAYARHQIQLARPNIEAPA